MNINIENSYRIEIGGIGQYIEADTMDAAIKRAKNTFHYNLYADKRKKSVLVQRACESTKIFQSIMFGFIGNGCAGWITIHPNEEKNTIFTMYERAKKHEFVLGCTVTEIHYNV